MRYLPRQADLRAEGRRLSPGPSGAPVIAVDAMGAAQAPHHFLSVTKAGHSAIVSTNGNEDCHVILRGGKQTNFDHASIDAACTELGKSGLAARVMVDFSHGSSRKDYKRQMEVSADVAGQLAAGEERIFGVMIESHLNEGRQDLHPGKPLARIAGKAMVQWVWEAAVRAPGIDRVVVATDDERIWKAVHEFGGEVVITDLFNRAMPLIRYRTRDLTRFIPGQCPCGRTHRRIDRVVVHPELGAVPPARWMHVHGLEEDERGAAGGPRFAVVHVALRDRAGRQREVLLHRRHENAVAEIEAADAAGGEEARERRHRVRRRRVRTPGCRVPPSATPPACRRAARRRRGRRGPPCRC